MFFSQRSALITRPSYASFDHDWEPAQYLKDYYQVVEPDEIATIDFFVNALSNAENGRPVMVFGVGPTLHHVFLAAERASEIHLADYLTGNLAQLQGWLDDEPTAHDWSRFVGYTLACEGVAADDAVISRRSDMVRQKVTALLQADAGVPDPLLGNGYPDYNTVISAYCADSATDDKGTWETYLRNIASKVRPGGLFITAALRHCTGYVVGDQMFPSADIDEADLRRVLEDDFDWDRGMLRVVDLPSHDIQGYTSILLAWVFRRP